MQQVLRYVGYILLLIVVGFLIWQFSFMIVWVLIAAVISFIGHPFFRFFDSVHIKKWHFPHALSAALSLIIVVLLFSGLLAVFVPLILKQADTISKIDVSRLAENLQKPLQWLEDVMHEFGVIPSGQTLPDFIVIKAKSVVNLGNVTTAINSIFSAAGTILVGIFSVLFIAFFFLKDKLIFQDGLLLFVPVKHHQSTRKVIAESKHLLMRYFIGIMLEVLCMMTIITLGLLLLGVENALLIGFFGGMMNIIPYLGPLIGAIIGVILAISTILSTGYYSQIVSVTIMVLAVFTFAKLIDDFILQPLIYSNSVKAHPVEIFLVILIAGTMAGITGMILAIPTYTVLRIVAKEFLSQLSVVQKLTKNI